MLPPSLLFPSPSLLFSIAPTPTCSLRRPTDRSAIKAVKKVRLGTEYDVQQELSDFYSVEIAFVAAKSMPR